jgi:hypothetical protein
MFAQEQIELKPKSEETVLLEISLAITPNRRGKVKKRTAKWH